jgi:hypothetical protein
VRKLSHLSEQEADAVIRQELEAAGVPCFESGVKNLHCQSRLTGILKCKRTGKVITFQRSTNSWIVRINTHSRHDRDSVIDKCAASTYYLSSTERDRAGKVVKPGKVVKMMTVKNQRKLARLVRLLIQYFGDPVEYTGDWNELIGQRLLLNYGSQPKPAHFYRRPLV